MKKLGLLVCTILLLVACEESSKTLQLSPSSITLHYEETQQVKVLDQPGSFEWSTENDFHATVSSTGEINAGHVGSTVIMAKQGKNEGTCSVKIIPKYYLYDTPYFGWGKTMNQIKNVLGNPYQTQENTLTYVLSESDGIVASYKFTDSKLTSIYVLINKKNATTLAYYLVERYQPFNVDDNNAYFIDAMDFDKATLVVMMSTISSGSSLVYYVIYKPANQQKNISQKQVDSMKMINTMIPDDLLSLFE